jgi:hypothetical protein
MLCLHAKCDLMLGQANNGHVTIQYKPIPTPFVAQLTEFTGTVQLLD